MSLRELASSKGFLIGVGIGEPRLRDEPGYPEVVAREFNVGTTHNEFKFYYVHGQGRGIYTFERADTIVNFAEQNDMKIRGHTLIKHEKAPFWLTQRRWWTRDELIAILQDHVKTVVSHYRGRVYAWDVVNEAVTNTGLNEDNFWYKKIGPEYIDLAFLAAREADPGAKLFYNDFGGEDINDPKANVIYDLVKSMKQRGIPIDGVGMQMHVATMAYKNPEAVAANMDRLAQLGLEVQITEMTVMMPVPPTHENLELQANIYGDILQVCLNQPACTAFVMWELSDKESTKYLPSYGYSTIFDENYQPKPAYHALVNALEISAPPEEPGGEEGVIIGPIAVITIMVCLSFLVSMVSTAMDWDKKPKE